MRARVKQYAEMDPGLLCCAGQKQEILAVVGLELEITGPRSATGRCRDCGRKKSAMIYDIIRGGNAELGPIVEAGMVDIEEGS